MTGRLGAIGAVGVVLAALAPGWAIAAPARPAAPAPSPKRPACDRGSYAERVICADPALAERDRYIRRLYVRALTTDLGGEARENQLRWEDELDDCTNVRCVREALEARVLALEQAGN
jgi:uncharacterized protein